MSVLEVRLVPHGDLRRPARPVEAFTDEVRQLARDLLETMYAHDGIGLAAPQVGRDLQLFVVNPSRDEGRELVIANPRLIPGQGRTSLVEGCLSVPSVWARVRRAGRVELQGTDLTGRPVGIQAEGLLAIVLQHEVDHLEGRLFIDRLPWWRRQYLRMKGTRTVCV